MTVPEEPRPVPEVPGPTDNAYFNLIWLSHRQEDLLQEQIKQVEREIEQMIGQTGTEQNDES